MCLLGLLFSPTCKVSHIFLLFIDLKQQLLNPKVNNKICNLGVQDIYG